MVDQVFADIINGMAALADENGVVYANRKYVPVKDRVEVFRREFGAKYGIDTDVRHDDGFAMGNVVVGVAKVIDIATGTVLASGHAMEIIGSDRGVASIEKAETSAIGRALACFGLHGSEYASANEMQSFEKKQNGPAPHAQQIRREQAPERPDERPAYIPQVGGDNDLYTPAEPFAVWLDHVEETNKCESVIDKIDNYQELVQYWNMLGEFQSALAKDDPGSLAQLKAAFSVRMKQLKA